ncbi:hypothetical protein DFO66_105180 [Brevibacterium sanguinis]|uniref:Uncharacterized protein n=2 Tax=Brevibacterium TaxID=1696 RepID=A0A366II89_9MICO|nr:hypothetical protein DFO66_105180 [Brevibacterium sanguinis]RBP71337.1 hypothetical protein DFO65_106180 [Brevibacterium celere]
MISQLEELAPVYQFTLRGDDRANWNQRVEEIADAVNRTEALADADIIFVTSDLRGGYDAATQTMMDSPVFKELPAVKAGHVYPHGNATIAGYADAMYDIEMAEKALEDYRNS